MPIQVNELTTSSSGGFAIAQAWTYKVKIGTLEATQANPRGLESIVVEDHVDKIGLAEVSFGIELDPWSAVDLGQDVRIEMGEDAERPVFVGLVTGLRHVRRGGRERLVVMAMDPLCRFAASRRVSAFTNTADTDIFRQVADRAGLTVRRADTGAFSRAFVLQRNESDLDFVRRLASRNGFILYAEEGELVFGAPSLSGAPLEIEEVDVRDIDWTMSTVQVPKGVDVHTWNVNSDQDVSGVSRASDVVKIGEGAICVDAPWSLWDDVANLSDIEIMDQTLAKVVADAELTRHAWTFLRGRAVVTGNPAVHADTRVKLVCAREGFRPDVWVVGTRHLMEPGRAYTTELQMCSNTRPG